MDQSLSHADADPFLETESARFSDCFVLSLVSRKEAAVRVRRLDSIYDMKYYIYIFIFKFIYTTSLFIYVPIYIVFIRRYVENP